MSNSLRERRWMLKTRTASKTELEQVCEKTPSVGSNNDCKHLTQTCSESSKRDN